MIKKSCENFVFSYAPGKAILVGEHAVVYGAQAIAVPLDLGVRVAILPLDANGPIIKGIGSFCPSEALVWSIEQGPANIKLALQYLIENFGEKIKKIAILVDGSLPKGFGLGSSAAFSVALMRAIFNYFSISINNQMLIEHISALETIFHGAPSGIDHTVVLNSQVLGFKKKKSQSLSWPIYCKRPLKLVVGLVGPHEGTKNAVQKLRDRKRQHEKIYERIFGSLDELAIAMETSLKEGSLGAVGEFMNMAHGYLSALGVSTGELDHLCAIAKERGALGAKLTGAGGGGAVIALAENNEMEIMTAFRACGFISFTTSVVNKVDEHL